MKKLFWILIPFIAISCAQKGKTKAGDAKKMEGKKMEKKVKEKAGEMKKEAEGAGEAAASGAEGATSSAGTVACKSGGDTRTIAVNTPEGGGCEVVYTKGDESNSVANAKNDLSYCDKVAGRIRSNLESAGFSCE